MLAKTSNKKPTIKHLLLLTALFTLASTSAGLIMAQSMTTPPVGDGKLAIEYVKRIPLTIISQSGHHQFNAEIANTEELRKEGLMWRQTIQQNDGMLFVYENSKIRNFWMKNTLIPLDIIFIDEKGVILNIAAGTPLSLQQLLSRGPAMYVFEIPQGRAKALGIKQGDRLNIHSLKNDITP